MESLVAASVFTATPGWVLRGTAAARESRLLSSRRRVCVLGTPLQGYLDAGSCEGEPGWWPAFSVDSAATPTARAANRIHSVAPSPVRGPTLPPRTDNRPRRGSPES